MRVEVARIAPNSAGDTEYGACGARLDAHVVIGRRARRIAARAARNLRVRILAR